MLAIFLHVTAIVIAGLMVGNELAVSVFVHPSLSQLNDTVHAPSAQSLARIYGKVMPFWYGLVLILTVAVAINLHLAWSEAEWIAILSVALWLLSIIFTLIGPVPINNQVIGWDLKHLPPDWKDLRKRWDWLHSIRVGIVFAAFVFLVTACLLAEAT